MAKLNYECDNIKELTSEFGVTANRFYKWCPEYTEHSEASFLGYSVEHLRDKSKRVK